MSLKRNNNMGKYDLAVAYRIYPKVSKVPPVHSQDKYKLSELCLKSFKESLGSLKTKMYVLLDNCPAEYEGLFEKYFDERDLVLLNYNGIGNQQTFGKQLDILLEQKESEFIYFAEDDYFYLPNEFSEMLELLRSREDVHFVSPYDHLDYYQMYIHKYKSEIIYSETKHWRTVSSTCMTFLTSKEILKQTLKVFETYTRKNDDYSLWLTLTKIRLYSIPMNLKLLLSQWEFFKKIIKAWLHSPLYNIFGKKMKLWVPIPSIAAHMDNRFLPPTKQWYEIFAKAEKG
jgi:hypothetical protein